VVFPGQGAHDLGMLEGIKSHANFAKRYEIVCEVLQSEPLAEIKKGNKEYVNQNLVSSVLTVLVSSLSWDSYVNSERSYPTYFAGYSVGQWTAMYAANMLSFRRLIEVICIRASFMDKCLLDQASGMLAVIGVAETKLEELCKKIQNKGHWIAISNYNCPGQFTLAGTEQAINLALVDLDNLQPKKYLRLPVSGAWHSPLLEQAAMGFRGYLQTVSFQPMAIPVINNVTGDFLPAEEKKLKDQLASHICSPVQWLTGIKKLIPLHCNSFIEVGYGNVLTKFGFFIDRSVHYEAFSSK
jgi:[acyl-carrier-protein] S-malonyltransferase